MYSDNFIRTLYIGHFLGVQNFVSHCFLLLLLFFLFGGGGGGGSEK